MDDLSYSYYPGKNQLQHVADAVTETTNANDIKNQSGNNYVYNEIGQLIYNTEENIAYTYTATGLVETISRPGVQLNFFYNDRGHRTQKESTISGLTTNTYYLRDVSGNVMAIYNEAGTGTTIEHPIYGNRRIGIAKRNLGQTTLSNLNYVYQLTDHLGNIRVVLQQDETGNAIALGKTDYYPFGMSMPERNMEGDYRYAFQGQEKDQETGKEVFELRLWDSRIGRWLTTDPYNQYNSPYLGMGNNPINMVDPDCGMACYDQATGLPIPCGDKFKRYSHLVSSKDAWFDSNGKFLYETERLNTVNLTNDQLEKNKKVVDGLATLTLKFMEGINVGKLNQSGSYRMYANSKSSPKFNGNQYTKLYRVGNAARVGGNIYTGIKLFGYGYDWANKSGKESQDARENFAIEGGVFAVSYFVPTLGVIYTEADVLSTTETFQQAKLEAIERANYDPLTTPLTKIREIRQSSGLLRDSKGRILWD